MSILSNFFGGGGKSPGGAASPYLDQIPGVGHKYYDDFIDRGGRAGGRLEDEYTGLLDDPTALMNKIMENYKTSEQYGYQKDQLGREIGATSAAGGVAGTPYHQQQQGEMVQGLLSKDMQDYLSKALGLYKTGLAGEEGFYDKGYGASGAMSDIETGALNQKGTIAYEDQKNKNEKRNALISSLLTAGGTGVGYLLGGPLGGKIGGSVGGAVGSRF